MKIHFIGIGGIGVSALAQYFLSKGDNVSGSDLASSGITNMLERAGAKIFIGPHTEDTLPVDSKLVIYSPAVSSENPEYKRAEELGLELKSYPEALGELTKQYFTIAVSGTHGKSTTTAMISIILKKAGFDPTVVIGTKVKEFGGTNFRLGKSKYLVIEADEWKASFLSYWPKIAVLTNIDEEHLDYYKNMTHILGVYKVYINHLEKDGVLVYNKDDKNIGKMLKKFGKKAVFKKDDFSIKQKEAKEIKKILKIPGWHNVYNALAALKVARLLEIPDEISLEALSEYEGAWRRFEIRETKFNDKSITIVSDYGHHPTEVQKTLQAAREKFPDRKIWCIFEPHQCQRTFLLFSSFVKVFRSVPVDCVIITDIYDVAGREVEEINVSAQMLVEKIKKPHILYLPYDEIRNYIRERVEENDVIIFMGAGNIYHLADKFYNE